MSRTHIIVSDCGVELERNIRPVLIGIIKKALEERGQAIVGVSGGSMSKILASVLKEETSVDWKLVKFFAVDERLVPLSDEESNTGKLLRLLPQRFADCFVSFGPIEDGIQCAKNYADSLVKLKPPMLNGFPQFDILMLGHGPDGHTCSLFPNHHLLKNTTDLVAYIDDSPKPPPRRITITMPVIQNARNIAFISTGEGKADIVKSILEERDESLPSVLAKPNSGELYWFLDTGSASKLQKK